MKTDKIIKKVKNKQKSKFIKGLTQSFKEVKLHQQGKKELKNAKDFIDELKSMGR